MNDFVWLIIFIIYTLILVLIVGLYIRTKKFILQKEIKKLKQIKRDNKVDKLIKLHKKELKE